ncbi:DUF4876 domain-containing protein [Sinomicrobium soli]|uniref:DUF4876 domain-containing protein n=1 Tax=Sinomicrobium sp. N-1-3-6 TaxID=2219864 RepID=UPI000DCD6C92|nr:DUF4876 domain-containing protein [Sinomicrobium sp. N-1-3-6]RAV28972.1 hypothetical protein DN748_11325 [Sinomicrobium sp. N-1-3-6]
MKHKTNKSLILLLSFFWLFMACSSDDDNQRLEQLELSVHVLYPEDFEIQTAVGVRVTMVDNASGQEFEQTTDADGMATFSGLVPGTYNVQAGKLLQGEEALAVTGNEVEINLNYLDNDFNLNHTTASSVLDIRLAGSIVGNLVISQVYYSGSKTPEGSNYFFDQFFEIYNNSSEPIALDGLIISDVYGVSGLINPGSIPSPFTDDDSHVYISTAWRIPGSGEEHILEPFSSITIAQQGINHQSEEANPGSPVDLSGADWEFFVEGSTRDIDAPDVPNLEMLYHPFNTTFSLVSVFGPGTIIWRGEDIENLERAAIPDAGPDYPQVLKVPATHVIDAVEALRSEEDGNFKRIPSSLDVGFTHVSDTYTGESIIRKSTSIDGNILFIDTNNSSEDFESSSNPQPGAY